jgi:hypothetical protein
MLLVPSTTKYNQTFKERVEIPLRGSAAVPSVLLQDRMKKLQKKQLKLNQFRTNLRLEKLVPL